MKRLVGSSDASVAVHGSMNRENWVGSVCGDVLPFFYWLLINEKGLGLSVAVSGRWLCEEICKIMERVWPPLVTGSVFKFVLPSLSYENLYGIYHHIP